MILTVTDLLWKHGRLRLIHHFGGVEVGVRGRPGGLEGVSVGEAALLPVTHHAPLHDRQPRLACAQWEVWGSTV